MIGNREHAETIAALNPAPENDFGDFAGDAPEGFTYLGSGSYRHAFLGPDGVVYKLHTYEARDEDGHGGNEDEWNRYSERPVFPKGIRFAECALYRIGYEPIIAMEYVSEKSRRIPEALIKAVLSAGVYDISPHNVRQRNGELIITDFAL